MPEGLREFSFAIDDFVEQSRTMQTKWAEENLQTIRTLMERSALYRRALAPVMIWCGVVGIAGGVVGGTCLVEISLRNFIGYWTCNAGLALSGSFVLARRQALKHVEPFWTPPTRRIAQSLLPCFFTGLVLSMTLWWFGKQTDTTEAVNLIMAWAFLFGCAANSASFFVARGMRYFGWAFIFAGCGLVVHELAKVESHSWLRETGKTPHLLMAAIFGGLHLAYGIYLYFTEKKAQQNPVA